MDAHSPDTRREIVRRVFPDLRYGGDPDLERYFELRKAGRLGEALNLYNGPLRARYPEDAARVLLLRLYRENDPRWIELQDRLVLELGERLCRRVAANIDALVAPLERADLSNPLKSLAAAEALQRLLPAAGDDAIPFLERYAGFARVLKHRVALAERAADLLREYFAMARSDAPGEYDFVARSAALEEKKREEEERRRAARGDKPDSGGKTESYDFIARSEALEERRRREEEARSRYFDLSRLEFSAADVERIEIPAGIERREDRVLAYCWKYWKACADPGFERLVFLYSKKYGTRHFDMLRAVKIGRARRFTDDEILTAVSTIVSPSYSYSVSGDLYMQTMWRSYRARLEEAARRQAESAATAALQDGDRAAPRSRAAVPARAAPALPPPAAPRPAPTPVPQPLPRPAAAPERPAAAPERRAALPESAAALRRTPDFASRPPAFALQDARERAAALAAESGAAGGAGDEPRSRAAFLARERSERADRLERRSADLAAAPHAPDHAAERTAAFEAARSADLRGELPRLSSRPAAARDDDEPRSRRAYRAETRASAEPEAADRQSSPAAARDGAGDGARETAPSGASGLKALSGGARKARGRELLGRREAPEAVPKIAQRAGSVSDRIRKLSGKAYDVYKEIFLARVRDAIHRRLLEGRRGARRFFDSGANEAEDLIYAYLAAHYDDPYMDWEGSDERRQVEALGFDLPSLDPIIEAWYRKL